MRKEKFELDHMSQRLDKNASLVLSYLVSDESIQAVNARMISRMLKRFYSIKLNTNEVDDLLYSFSEYDQPLLEKVFYFYDKEIKRVDYECMSKEQRSLTTSYYKPTKLLTSLRNNVN